MSYSSTCSAWNTRWAHRKRQPGKWPSGESSSIHCQHDLTFAVRWGKTYIFFVWTYPALVLCYVSKPTKKSRFKTSSRNYWNFFFHSSFELVHMWIKARHGTDLHFRACHGGLFTSTIKIWESNSDIHAWKEVPLFTEPCGGIFKL